MQLACRSEMESRAKELIEMIASPALLPLAIKYASKLGRIHLAEKLNEMLPAFEELVSLKFYTKYMIIINFNMNRRKPKKSNKTTWKQKLLIFCKIVQWQPLCCWAPIEIDLQRQQLLR